MGGRQGCWHEREGDSKARGRVNDACESKRRARRSGPAKRIQKRGRRHETRSLLPLDGHVVLPATAVHPISTSTAVFSAQCQSIYPVSDNRTITSRRLNRISSLLSRRIQSYDATHADSSARTASLAGKGISDLQVVSSNSAVTTIFITGSYIITRVGHGRGPGSFESIVADII